MKVLHYNIFNGFKSINNGVNLFIEFIQKIQPDVLMLNEYNIDTSLKPSLLKAGYIYSSINDKPENDNKSAIFSKIKFNDVKETPADLRLVAVNINGTTFISYHASPLGVNAVFQELTFLQNCLPKGESIILCGDLNSLSAEDSIQLNYNSIMGTSSVERYSVNGKICYEVINTIKSYGLHDVIPKKCTCNTVPTSIVRKHENGVPLRLDYVFSSDDLMVKNIEIIKCNNVNSLSDHYPIHFEL